MISTKFNLLFAKIYISILLVNSSLILSNGIYSKLNADIYKDLSCDSGVIPELKDKSHFSPCLNKIIDIVSNLCPYEQAILYNSLNNGFNPERCFNPFSYKPYIKEILLLESKQLVSSLTKVSKTKKKTLDCLNEVLIKNYLINDEIQLLIQPNIEYSLSQSMLDSCLSRFIRYSINNSLNLRRNFIRRVSEWKDIAVFNKKKSKIMYFKHKKSDILELSTEFRKLQTCVIQDNINKSKSYEDINNLLSVSNNCSISPNKELKDHIIENSNKYFSYISHLETDNRITRTDDSGLLSIEHLKYLKEKLLYSNNPNEIKKAEKELNYESIKIKELDNIYTESENSFTKVLRDTLSELRGALLIKDLQNTTFIKEEEKQDFINYYNKITKNNKNLKCIRHMNSVFSKEIDNPLNYVGNIITEFESNNRLLIKKFIKNIFDIKSNKDEDLNKNNIHNNIDFSNYINYTNVNEDNIDSFIDIMAERYPKIDKDFLKYQTLLLLRAKQNKTNSDYLKKKHDFNYNYSFNSINEINNDFRLLNENNNKVEDNRNYQGYNAFHYFPNDNSFKSKLIKSLFLYPNKELSSNLEDLYSAILEEIVLNKNVENNLPNCLDYKKVLKSNTIINCGFSNKELDEKLKIALDDSFYNNLKFYNILLINLSNTNDLYRFYPLGVTELNREVKLSFPDYSSDRFIIINNDKCFSTLNMLNDNNNNTIDCSNELINHKYIKKFYGASITLNNNEVSIIYFNDNDENEYYNIAFNNINLCGYEDFILSKSSYDNIKKECYNDINKKCPYNNLMSSEKTRLSELYMPSVKECDIYPFEDNSLNSETNNVDNNIKTNSFYEIDKMCYNFISKNFYRNGNLKLREININDISYFIIKHLDYSKYNVINTNGLRDIGKYNNVELLDDYLYLEDKETELNTVDYELLPNDIVINDSNENKLNNNISIGSLNSEYLNKLESFKTKEQSITNIESNNFIKYSISNSSFYLFFYIKILVIIFFINI